jgi:hypothetical protein
VLDPKTGYTAVLRDIVSSRPRMAELRSDHAGRAAMLDNLLVDARAEHVAVVAEAREELEAFDGQDDSEAWGGGRAAKRRRGELVDRAEAARAKERRATEAATYHHAQQPPPSETVQLLRGRRAAVVGAFNELMAASSVLKPPTT